MIPGARTWYLLWAVAAAGIAFGRALVGLPIFIAPILIFTLTTAQLVAYFFGTTQRALIDSFSDRALTIFHLWRVVPGAAFLYLHYEKGIFTKEMATVAGIGDTAVALTAPFAALLAGRKAKWPTVCLFIWHLFGFADLANVIRLALKSMFQDPRIMAPMLEPPLALLPTILVPITLFLHLVMLYRVGKSLRTAAQ